MFESLRGYFSEDFAIDLGTVNTLIWERGEGVVLDEPSMVALRHEGAARNGAGLAAVGTEAKTMLGRTPTGITAVRPLRDGVIADFAVTEKMLHEFLRQVRKQRVLRHSPRIVVCAPCGSTSVERRAIRESAIQAGARQVFLIEEPMAAAIGAGLPVHEPVGSMVVDIGGGTTEVAVISYKGIVYSESLRVAGNRLDTAIIDYVRRVYRVLIGEATAERLKIDIGTAYPGEDFEEVEVGGQNLTEGVPCTLVLNSREVCEAMQAPLTAIGEAVRRALDHIPPELAVDVKRQGMTLTGGGALLHGIDRMLAEHTGIGAAIAKDPLTCVARGAGLALDMFCDSGVNLFDTK